MLPVGDQKTRHSSAMKTIWTNGCFDVLHIGHIRLFKYAKSLGNKLLVGIDSDRRVGELKGATRPINNQKIRKEFLLSIKYIDDVFIFDTTKELTEIIKDTSDTIVVGSDYKNKEVVGSLYAEVVFFDRIEGFSTTGIIK